MGYVAIESENITPIERHSEERGAVQPRARCGEALTRTRSASYDRGTTPAGGISIAAVLGGTLLRWGRVAHDTPIRRAALRP